MEKTKRIVVLVSMYWKLLCSKEAAQLGWLSLGTVEQKDFNICWVLWI